VKRTEDNQNVYSILTSYATAICTGNAVRMSGTGKNIENAVGTEGSASMDMLGVFVGCSYTDANGKPTFSAYWPGVSDGKTNIKAFVLDDPETVFEVAADSIAEGDVGALCNFNLGTGSALTGLSGSYAVVTGQTATTGKQLRIMGLVDRPDNAYGSYAKIEVMFATHALARVVSGVGGV